MDPPRNDNLKVTKGRGEEGRDANKIKLEETLAGQGDLSPMLSEKAQIGNEVMG